MYKCYVVGYASFDEESIKFIIADRDWICISEAFDYIREELMRRETLTVADILSLLGCYSDIPDSCTHYIIDSIDEFDNTHIERHKYGLVADEYVAEIKGIKRAP